MTRRSFVRRSTVFLPLAFFAASTFKSAALSTIVNRTISGGSQNAISMSNSSWARPVALPLSWLKVRVGCRLHMTNTAATLTGNPIFTFGLCSGTTNQYGDAATTHFVGNAFDRSTFSYVAGPPVYYTVPIPVGRTRIGTTNADSAALVTGPTNSSINAGAGTATADRQMLFLDIFKGSPNFTFHVPFYADPNGANPGDVSAATFLGFMGQLNPVPGGGYNGAGLITDQTLAVNEAANGFLNAINFCWNRADATLEICDVAVAVLA